MKLERPWQFHHPAAFFYSGAMSSARHLLLSDGSRDASRRGSAHFFRRRPKPLPFDTVKDSTVNKQILLGNEAFALGLVESGCTMATSYPGTPASEILRSLVDLRDREGLKLHLEWSVNEKVAFEVALANSYAGRRSAVIMKQVGLNVAADPLMSAAYTGVKGGFVIIVADDPGPHSSQTEQDSRLYAMMAKIPVMDPASPAEARQFVPLAFALSEQYEIPVMLRPTTRICHARQDLEWPDLSNASQMALFEKNPTRWAATPKFRLMLHHQLNDKIRRISEEPRFLPQQTNAEHPAGSADAAVTVSGDSRSCVVASGVVYSHALEVMADLGLLQDFSLYKVPLPYPLPTAFVERLLASHDKVLVLEESYPVIEMQFQARHKILGRTSGTVPSAGELLPEVVENILRSFAGMDAPRRTAPAVHPGRRPTLCAGCPHRAAFFAIKKAFPKGIYPGDIGCYTLGLNLGAVDTVLCMGASIGLATGFYHGYRASREGFPSICATIGDSTFFHAGIPPLMNAVVQGARFVLVILDNSTTAMTGHQPTPEHGRTLDGTPVPSLSIPDLVRACGVRFVQVGDPYEMKEFLDLLKRAGEFAKSDDGGVAVVIAKRPCLMDRGRKESWGRHQIKVSEKCKSCDFCIKQFECPALQPQGEKEPIRIDETLCSGCGVCVHVCPHGALERTSPADC